MTVLVDPHFQTFDGTQYSFHGECDLVMARSASFGNNTSIDIHARTTMVDNWSLISNAAIKVGKDILEIVNDNSYYLNGVKNVGFPLTMDGQHVVKHHEEMFTSNEEVDAKPEVMAVYTIEVDTGSIKVSNYRGMIQVDVNAALVDTLGMMGSQHMVGMIARNKETVLTEANEMGAEWQVRDNEPMLFHEVRAPQYPQTCTLPTITGRRNLRKSDNEMKMAEAACSSVGESHRHFCIEDSLLSGDIKMAHAYRFRV
jgi:von Willebrand factor type D domain